MLELSSIYTPIYSITILKLHFNPGRNLAGQNGLLGKSEIRNMQFSPMNRTNY